MPVVLRLRSVPPELEVRLRDAIDASLDGNWTVTVSQSHLDGQWHLQLAGDEHVSRIALPAIPDATVSHLEELIRQLVPAAAQNGAAHRQARR